MLPDGRYVREKQIGPTITARQPVSRQKPFERERGTDPAGGQRRRATLVEEREDHRALRHAGGRAGQAIEVVTVGVDLLLAAEVLDDPLLGVRPPSRTLSTR